MGSVPRVPSWLWPLLGLAGACSPPAAEPFQARFAVRGRWPGERSLTWALDDRPGVLTPDVTRAALQAALEEWQATGLVRFQRATGAGTADLIVGWRQGKHDACPAFGADPGFAHTGPVGPGCFVHLDLERNWSATDGQGLSLRAALLHEVGHVLGLDHSPDEEALMYPEPSPARAHIARADLAGLHSLYGGGARGDGDLEIRGASRREPAAVLYQVAPSALCGWGLLDTDQDGSQEILVWRRDGPRATATRGSAGAPRGAPRDALGGAQEDGSLWTFHFQSGPDGPELVRTQGPYYGVTSSAVALVPRNDPEHGAHLLVRLANGRVEARRFDSGGMPSALEELAPEAWDERAEREAVAPSTLEGDLDGDGRVERVTRVER